MRQAENGQKRASKSWGAGTSSRALRPTRSRSLGTGSREVQKGQYCGHWRSDPEKASYRNLAARLRPPQAIHSAAGESHPVFGETQPGAPQRYRSHAEGRDSASARYAHPAES